MERDRVKHEGVQVGMYRITLLRKELGLRYRQIRKFTATTNSKHSEGPKQWISWVQTAYHSMKHLSIPGIYRRNAIIMSDTSLIFG